MHVLSQPLMVFESPLLLRSFMLSFLLLLSLLRLLLLLLLLLSMLLLPQAVLACPLPLLLE